MGWIFLSVAVALNVWWWVVLGRAVREESRLWSVIDEERARRCRKCEALKALRRAERELASGRSDGRV